MPNWQRLKRLKKAVRDCPLWLVIRVARTKGNNSTQSEYCFPNLEPNWSQTKNILLYCTGYWFLKVTFNIFNKKISTCCNGPSRDFCGYRRIQL